MAVITHFIPRNKNKIAHSRLLSKKKILNKYLKYQKKKKKKKYGYACICVSLNICAGKNVSHLIQPVFFIN